MPETWHAYARFRELEDFVTLGWIPWPSLEGVWHGEYRVHVEWRCCCGRAPPLPEEARGRAERRQPRTS